MRFVNLEAKNYFLIIISFITFDRYRVFLGFGQAKFACGGSVLGTSQFTILPELPLKMMLDLVVVKIDSKIIISLQ